MKKNKYSNWNLEHGYLSKSTQLELSNEYQYDRI